MRAPGDDRLMSALQIGRPPHLCPSVTVGNTHRESDGHVVRKAFGCIEFKKHTTVHRDGEGHMWDDRGELVSHVEDAVMLAPRPVDRSTAGWRVAPDRMV